MTLKQILASKLWFLLGFIIFLMGGIRYYLNKDTVGAIIYFIASLFFLMGYIGQAKYNKPKKR